jgi:ApaG protein
MMTFDIKIDSKVRFIEEYSQEDRYVFAYKITIDNQSDKTVKLLSRFWRIVDANNEQQIVKGKGVVGQTPTIKPGSKFDYTSNACVDTPLATMQGSFQMIDEDDRLIDVMVPIFSLAVPNLVN